MRISDWSSTCALPIYRALVRELLLREADGLAPLAMYLVPSRALADEVEAKLRSELGSDLTIPALYGGADWGIHDAWLRGDKPIITIATVRKADALNRHFAPTLTATTRPPPCTAGHPVRSRTQPKNHPLL